jgi:hypothetical protein
MGPLLQPSRLLFDFGSVPSPQYYLTRTNLPRILFLLGLTARNFATCRELPSVSRNPAYCSMGA